MILRARIDCTEETCSNQEKKLIWKWDDYNMGITSNIHVLNLDRPAGGGGGGGGGGGWKSHKL